MNKQQTSIFTIGKKVYFTNEKLPYIVMAVSDRYAVVSGKLNRRQDAELLHHEVEMGAYQSFTEAYKHNKDTPIYSLIDFKENKRSSDNLVFGIFDYFKEEGCKEAIQYLETGRMELSDRNIIELSVDPQKCDVGGTAGLYKGMEENNRRRELALPSLSPTDT